MGESVGGGRIRISGVNDVRIRMSGDMPTIFVSHRDKPGVLAALTNYFGYAKHQCCNYAYLPLRAWRLCPHCL